MAERPEKDEFRFEIVREIGAISEGYRGWHKELNSVRWGDHEPKYDLREWSPDHLKMGKGVTLSESELRALKALLDCELGEGER